MIVLSVEIRKPIADRFGKKLIANEGTVGTNEVIIRSKARILRQINPNSPNPGGNSQSGSGVSGGHTMPTTPVTTPLSTTTGSVSNDTTTSMASNTMGTANPGVGAGSADYLTAETQSVTETTTTKSTSSPSVWPVFAISFIFVFSIIVGLIWVLKGFCEIRANEELEETRIGGKTSTEAKRKASKSLIAVKEKGPTGDHKKPVPPTKDKEVTTRSNTQAITTTTEDKSGATKDSTAATIHLKSPKSPDKQSATDKSPVSSQDTSSPAPGGSAPTPANAVPSKPGSKTG
ncbi:unnamed protein product [Medioppia subpectinata]|uniref:Uncharacterized protein n=1 Tax=Medioppia subpectinata TaxID=1979941 RepID=A0A7R9KM81_9ACAR|nr:unnamed protein product [Medioppia subpectinata]CAG2106202.1 unnamed protein product [Medioppia subpectinata]